MPHRAVAVAVTALAGVLAAAGPQPAHATETSTLHTVWLSEATDLGTTPSAPMRCSFTLRPHARASSVVLRLRNNADAPVTLTEVVVATSETPTPLLARPTTAQGSATITLGAGSSVTTDSTPVALAPADALRVTFTDRSPGVPVSQHGIGLETGSCKAVGGGSVVDQPAPWFLDAVFADGARPECDVAVIGDSISDGLGLPSGSDRWTDLAASGADGQLVIADAAISGNRVTSDAHGFSALHRLGSDALDLPGITALVIEDGTNDLGGGVSASSLLAAYRAIVTSARARGVPVFAATILPRGGSIAWTKAKERQRQLVNAALRKGGIFDGLLDFDRAVRGGGGRLQAAFAQSDWLHLSPAGQRALAMSSDVQRLATCS